MPAPYTGHDLDLLHLTVAPWLVGCFLDLFTQGILACQFSNYFSWYKDDKPLMRYAVMGLVLLTILKLLDSCAAVWISLVENFGDLDGAVNLSYTAWWQSGVPLMGATMDFYCQAYFLYRLLALSKRSWAVIPVALLLVFAFVSGIILTVYIKLEDNLNLRHWFAAHLGSAFAADLLMTITTGFFLLQTRKNSLKQTQTLIDMLIKLTWQSAAPSAVCALVNLILSQWRSEFLVSTIPNMLLPKLYAISMMWTINSRKTIRLVSASGKTTSSDGMVTNQRSGRTGRAGDVELGRLGTAIHVHKETTTIQRVDWADGHASIEDVKDGALYGRDGGSTIREDESESPRAL
ncbi:hypothetical protein EXIGLDRAFT_754205 [Exidia glandulosa HHB12029]|uniref:DUF6534 domain-containing protein n=1 Tax=Exidia glandulosa HHB12029 TaxID=1314781 RepID=A0A165D4L9_EXIGL|nr:hypothetical protein EXIGLDRAFT_754205 [Exidia glandulosa HHB12029]